MYPGPLKKGRAELNLCINRLKAINPTTIHSNDFLCTIVKEESMEKLAKKKKKPSFRNTEKKLLYLQSRGEKTQEEQNEKETCVHQGQKGGGGINWESVINIHTLLYI